MLFLLVNCVHALLNCTCVWITAHTYEQAYAHISMWITVYTHTYEYCTSPYVWTLRVFYSLLDFFYDDLHKLQMVSSGLNPQPSRDYRPPTRLSVSGHVSPALQRRVLYSVLSSKSLLMYSDFFFVAPLQYKLLHAGTVQCTALHTVSFPLPAPTTYMYIYIYILLRI